MSFSFLDVSRISFIREGKPVLKNISFSLTAGHKIVIAGETGSGKSTLLKIIAGLEQPADGATWLNGEKVKGPVEQLVAGHPKIAYLSQHFELAKFLRVEQVLEYANHLSSSAANKIFSVCKINHLMKRKTDELSGGEKQRIAIARLLIQQPDLLLLDEPYSHLDMPLKNTLKGVVDDIGRKLKISCILVSHDPDDTLPWADEIIILKNGRVVQQGSASAIYRNPKNEYVAGLFGNYTLLDKAKAKRLGIKSLASKIFARPEDFSIVKSGAKTISGEVTEILYLGNHYLMKVKTGNKILLAKAEPSGYFVGAKIKLGLKKFSYEATR
jgi:ABC-type Fe3+/spermidine/putrescine transport system ATPase subunit